MNLKSKVFIGLLVLAIIAINYNPDIAWFLAGFAVTATVGFMVLGIYQGDFSFVPVLTPMEIFLRVAICVLGLGICEILIFFGHSYVGTMTCILIFGISVLESLHKRKIKLF